MKIPRLLIALAAAALVALPATLVHATGDTTIVSIATQGCADNKACVTLTVDNPVAGTIRLKLTGHTPGSAVFVDTGARLTFTIVPGTTTYTGCFENLSSLVTGLDFNTLRVEFESSDIANLQGTTTKSISFPPCTSPTPSPTPTPTPSGTPTPTPSSSQPPGSSPTPAVSPGGGSGAGALAETGGFDFRFLLAGLALLVAGLSVLGVSLARSRSPQP